MTAGIVLIGHLPYTDGTIHTGEATTHGGARHSTTALITAGMTLGIMAADGMIHGTTVMAGTTLGGVPVTTLVIIPATIQVITPVIILDTILYRHTTEAAGTSTTANVKTAAAIPTAVSAGAEEVI